MAINDIGAGLGNITRRYSDLMRQDRLHDLGVVAAQSTTQPGPSDRGRAIASQLADRASVINAAVPQGRSPLEYASVAPVFNPALFSMQDYEQGDWVEVQNDEDEDDFIQMPASLATNLPPGWSVTGTIDDQYMDFVTSGNNQLSIYNQPPEVQAAFGIGVPSSSGAIDPKDVRPTDTSIIATSTYQPDQPSSYSLADIPGDVIDFISGLPVGDQGNTVGGTAGDLWSVLQDTPIPGTAGNNEVKVGTVTSSLEPGVDTGMSIINDIMHSNPIDWLRTEGGQMLSDWGDVFQFGEGEDDLTGKITGTVQDVFQGVGSTFDFLTPETLEDVGNGIVYLANLPFEQSSEWRVNTIMKAQNGEPLTPLEEAWLNVATVWNQGTAGLEDIPILGPIIQQTENVVPLDLEAWMLQNTDEVNAAYERGGAQEVWETYQKNTTGEGVGGMFLRLIRDVTNDPLTYPTILAPVAGEVGKAGTALRLAPDASPGRIILGSALEKAGYGTRGLARAAEQVGDMFIEPVGGAILRPATRYLDNAAEAVRDARLGVGPTPTDWQRRADRLNPFSRSDRANRDVAMDELDQILAITQRDALIPGESSPTVGAPITGTSNPPTNPVPTRSGSSTSNPPTNPPPIRPEPAAQEPPVQAQPEAGAVPTGLSDQERIDLAQKQPQPGMAQKAVGDNVEYTPTIRLRRVKRNEWEVTYRDDDGVIQAMPATRFHDALAQAEELRQSMKISAQEINVTPPRWQVAPGETTMNARMQEAMTPEQREQFRRTMDRAWNESVERMMAQGTGKPSADHAIESSRIAWESREEAAKINPAAREVEYEPNTTQDRGTPYQATEEIIFQDWADTVAQRAYLYGNPQREGTGWRPEGSKRQPTRITRNRPIIRDKLPKNIAQLQGQQRADAIRAAQRYVDIVNEHHKWNPDDPMLDSRGKSALEKAADLQRQIDAARGAQQQPLSPAPEPQAAEPAPAKIPDDAIPGNTEPLELQSQDIPESQPQQGALFNERPQPRRSRADMPDDPPPGSRAELVEDAPVTESGPVPEGAERDTTARIYRVDPTKLVLEPETFQPRSTISHRLGIDDDVVNAMVENWDPNGEAVRVWERKPGEWVVYAGHNRMEAALRLQRMNKLPDGRVRVEVSKSIDVDEAEVRQAAADSNRIRNNPGPIDRAKELDEYLAGNPDATVAQIRKKFPDITSNVDVNRLRVVKHLPTSLKIELKTNWNALSGDYRNPQLMTLRKAGVLGDAIENDQLTPAEAETFWREKGMGGEDGSGYTEKQFATEVHALSAVKELVKDQVQATSMFGDGSLFGDGDFGSSSLGNIMEIEKSLNDKKLELKRRRKRVDDVVKAEGENLKKGTVSDLEKRVRQIERAIRQEEKDRAAALKRIVEGIQKRNGAMPDDAVTPNGHARTDDLRDTVLDVPEPSTTDPITTVPKRIQNAPELFNTESPADQPSIFQAGTSDTVYMNWPVDLRKAGQGARTLVTYAKHGPDGIRRMNEQARLRAANSVQRSTSIPATQNGAFLWDRPLGWQEEAFLNKMKLADGRTLIEALDDTRDELMNGKSRLYREDAEIEAIAQVRDQFEDHLAETFKGVALPVPLRAAGSVLDGLMQYFRERVLFDWLGAVHYPLTQAVGNTAILLVNGRPHWIPKYLGNALGARREIRAQAGIKQIGKIDDQIRKFHASKKPGPLARHLNEQRVRSRAKIMDRLTNQLYAELAPGDRTRALRMIRKDPSLINKVWMSDPGMSSAGKLHMQLKTRAGRKMRDMYEGMVGSIDDPLIVEKVLTRLGGAFGPSGRNLGKLGRLTGSKRIAVWGSYWDLAMRETIWESQMRQELATQVPDFRNYTIDRMMGWGHSKADATAAWNDFWAKARGGVFNSDDVRRHFENVLDQGQAIRLQRDWQARIFDMEKRSTDEVRRISFAGDETRADVALRKIMVFHWFFARQAKNFGQQMLRHPLLTAIYVDIQDELALYAQENDGFMPDWMKGYIAVLGSDRFGLNLFLNPTTLFSTYLMFREDSSYLPDEITQGGTWLQQADDWLGLNPFLITGANLLGYMGEAYAPDPFVAYKESKLVTDVINFARARGWLGEDVGRRPAGNVYTDAMEGVRETTSGIAPGSADIPATSSAARMEEEVTKIAIDEAEKMGLDPLNNEDDWIWVNEQLQDPNSDLYLRAVKRYTAGELLETTMKSVLGPFRPQVRQGQTSSDEEGPAGTNPDLSDHATSTQEGRGLVYESDPEARKLEGQMTAFYQIGSEHDRSVGELYSQIMDGTLASPIMVNNRTYWPADIRDMSDDQRSLLAQSVLEEQGWDDSYYAMLDERHEFLSKEENRELAQFKTWQKEVSGWDGGVNAYWQELIEDNPDAARYYESVQDANYTDEKRDQHLANLDAYMASKGIRISSRAPNPVADSYLRVADPAGILNTDARPTPVEEHVDEYDKTVREETPKVAAAIMAGEEDVNVPWQVEQYLDWVASPDSEGTDKSIDAYLQWNQEQYDAGVVDRFEQSQSAPMTTDQILGILMPLRDEKGNVDVEDPTWGWLFPQLDDTDEGE